MKTEDLKLADETWLRDMGATRPMSACGVTYLVLGEWQKSKDKETGSYPVSYHAPFPTTRNSDDVTWYHYQEKLDTAPTREQCLVGGVGKHA